MANSVLIVWGQNEELAIKLSESLRKQGTRAIVGGHDDDPHNRNHYLGANIIRQIKECSSAIILAEPKVVRKRQAVQYEYRPNLMFEWGYVTAWIPPSRTCACIIGSQRTALPADSAGMIVKEFPAYNRDDAHEIGRLANRIADEYKLSMTPLAPKYRDVWLNWSIHSRDISSYIFGFRACDPCYLSRLLIAASQPIVYTRSEPYIKRALQTIQIEDEMATQTIGIFNAIMDYYSLAHNSEEFADPEGLRRIRRSLESHIDFVHPIDRAWACDFIGLCERGIAQSDPVSRQDRLAKAIRWFEMSVSEIVGVKDEDKFAGDLLQSYALRNIGRTKIDAGDVDGGVAALTESLQARSFIESVTNSCDTDDIKIGMAIEIALVESDIASVTKNVSKSFIKEKIKVLNNYQLKPSYAWLRLREFVDRMVSDHGYQEYALPLQKLGGPAPTPDGG